MRKLYDQIKKYYFFTWIARDGGRALQTLSAEKRSDIIMSYANKLLENQNLILEANKKDLELGKKNSKKQKLN